MCRCGALWHRVRWANSSQRQATRPLPDGPRIVVLRSKSWSTRVLPVRNKPLHNPDPSAETDVAMQAEILTYSRARGLFGGVSLAGSTLRPHNNANKHLYGKEVPAKDIVMGMPPLCRRAQKRSSRRKHRP